MAQAPGLQVSILPLARRAAMDALSASEVDMALGFFWNVPDSLLCTALYPQGFAVVGRADVLGSAPLSLERYADLSHGLVSPNGDLTGVVDTALATVGLARRVVASAPQFFPALAIAAQTTCVATLPEGLAWRYAAQMGLVMQMPPLPVRSFTVCALRHRRNENDLRLKWLTSCLRTVVSAFSDTRTD